MDPPILHGVDNHFQLLRCEPSHVLRYKPHACLCIELPHLTRRLLVARATRTNIKADSSPLCVPRLGKLLTGCKKGLRVYDRAPSPLGRRQVNGHCLQGGCYRSRALCPVTSLVLLSLETSIGHSRGNAAAGSITHQRSKLIAPEIIHHERNLKVALLNNCA